MGGYHGTHGAVVELLEEHAESVPGDARDRHLYRVTRGRAERWFSSGASSDHQSSDSSGTNWVTV